MTGGRKVVLVSVVALAVALAFTCVGVWIPGIDVAFLLAFGWVPYVLRVVPRVRVRWEGVGSTFLYAAANFAGAHFFLRWLWREWGRAAPEAAAPGPAWPWRRTAGGLALVLLVFVAGVAMVGVVHQVAWLARSPEPMYRRGNVKANRIKCASNLRQIGYAIQNYVNSHGGRFPDDFRQLLLADEDVEAVWFVCPGTDDERAPGETREEQARHLLEAGHCSYLYFGKGLVGPVDPGRVLATEPVENHEGDGVNVLRADYQVTWVEGEEVDRVLTGLGLERVDVPRR